LHSRIAKTSHSVELKGQDKRIFKLWNLLKENTLCR
jgi:hypothetical protein